MAKRHLPLLAAGLCYALPLQAFEAQSPLSVTIHKWQDSDTSPSLEAARKEQEAIAGGAEVVDSSAWDKGRATTLKDVFDFTPGVFVQQRNGAEAQRIAIRGSGLARAFQGRGLLLMQDGIPINTADGSFDFQAVDPWLVRYAQVYKGANAVAYGASNLGGMINLVTPTGHDEQARRARLEGGSFGTVHGMASAGRVDGNTDAFASLTGFHQDGFRNHNRQESLRFSGNGGWKPSADAETRFYLGYINTDAEIPGSLTKAQLVANPKAANPANVAGDFARGMDIFRLASKTSLGMGDGRLDSTTFFSRRLLDNPATVYIVSRANDVGERLQYRVMDGPHLWRTGLNVQYGLTNEVRNANDAGSRGALVVLRDQEALTTEHYVEYDQAWTQQLHLIASLQEVYGMRRQTETFPAAVAQRKNYFGINPRIGALYEAFSHVQWFANISRSFEPPTLSELSGGNDPGIKQLRAQRGITAEVGTRGEYGATRFDVSLSRGWLENEFITYRVGAANVTLNAPHTLHDVAEIGVSRQWSEELRTQLAYTWNRLAMDDDATFASHQLAGIPEHYLRARAQYQLPGGWEVAPDVEWVPQGYPIDFANTFFTSPYAIFGLTVSYVLPGTDVMVYVNGHNLLDKTYIATTGTIPTAMGADQNQFFPGEGRAFYAGLKLAW